MKEPKLVIVGDTGLDARAKNPHTNGLGGIPLGRKNYEAWQKFDKANPPYPLTKQMEPGALIKGLLVWQRNYETEDGWMAVKNSVYGIYSSFEQYLEYAKSLGFLVRQAFEPIEQETKGDIKLTNFEQTVLNRTYQKTLAKNKIRHDKIELEVAKSDEGEDNVLIAEFMGVSLVDWVDVPTYDFKDLKCIYKPCEMKYHTSWDWLMPVVGNIENIELMGCQVYINIGPFSVSVYCSGHIEKGLSQFNYELKGRKFNDPEKRQAVYECVIRFIKWYNTQTK